MHVSGCVAFLVTACLAVSVLGEGVLPPQDRERVGAIAAMLRPEAGFAETRVTNRLAWGRIAQENVRDVRWILERAEKDLARTLPTMDDADYFKSPEPGGSGGWLESEDELVGALLRMTFAECLEGKGRFVPHIGDALDVLSSARTWVVPYHDRAGRSFKGEIRKIELRGGIVAMVVAQTVDLLKDVLPPETVARAKKAVWDKELEVYLGMARDGAIAEANDCWWIRSEFNWNAACNYYMVSAALQLLDDPRQRAECIELAERSTPLYLKGFSPDGLCLEGPSYWDYGFGSYLLLAIQVRRATGGRDPFVTPFAEKIMASGFEVRYNDLNAPSYGDAGGRELLDAPVQVWTLGAVLWPRFSCPLIQKAAGLSAAGLVLAAALRFPSDGWGCDLFAGKPYAYPLRSWYDEGAQQLVCRPRPGATNALYAAIKGGHNGANHNHNDVGTYSVAVDGLELVCDPGCKEYDKDTFTPKRYEENTRNSYGHPVPFVDGTMQSTGAKFAARVVSTSFTDACDELKLDLKGAYACDKVDKLVRRFAYRRDCGRLVVTDGVRFKRPGAFESPIITFGTVNPKGDGLYEIVYRDGRCRVMCRVQATGGKLVTKSEDLAFIGKKGDPRARGVPKRLAFAFAEPVTEAAIEFTYWIPTDEKEGEAER